MSGDVNAEKIEVIYGIENVRNLALQAFDHVKERMDTCADSSTPISLLKVEPMFRRLTELKARGVRLRLITEITKDNISYCKELMKIEEVRHMDEMKGNFAVIDGREYRGGVRIEVGQDPKAVIRSTMKDFVEQQQYFFETLWNKAIPASVRIGQIQEGLEPELTEIVTGWPGIIQRTVDGFSKAIRGVDHCCDSMIPPQMVVSPANKAISDFFNRGGKTRMITEITKENLPSVKELMKTQEVRHIGAFKLNFGVSETMFSAPTSVYSVSGEPQCIWSNSKDLIRQHQYLFDTLWRRALPVELRIREIEEGIAPYVTKTIGDPDQVQKLHYELVKSAEEEIMIIFSTSNAFTRQGKSELQLLKEASSKGVKVRILLPFDNEMVGNIVRNLKDENSSIEIRDNRKPLRSMLTTMVVDQLSSLTVNLKGDARETTEKSMELATYSNDDSTVLTCISIFENLWIQTEMAYKKEKRREKEAAAT